MQPTGFNALSVVKHISDSVAVMYLGRIVEMASKRDIYLDPRHPYTRALLSAAPSPRPASKRHRQVVAGDVPSPINPPPGCHFNTRCPLVEDRCRRTPPPSLDEIGPGHLVRCWRAA